MKGAARAVCDALLSAGCACNVCVNGCLEDAVAAGASGLHLRERWLSAEIDLAEFVSRARVSLGGSNSIIGCSAHSVKSVLTAASAGVDYVLVGTMFPTQTHPEKVEVEGPNLIASALEALDAMQTRPLLIGVGGINSANCAGVIESGADGVAVIRAISDQKQPADAAASILSVMRDSVSRHQGITAKYQPAVEPIPEW